MEILKAELVGIAPEYDHWVSYNLGPCIAYECLYGNNMNEFGYNFKR